MPAINVARTDTFEIQRQKINEIGTQIFGLTQGGSDLATGNLRLGDGTRTAPSLAFSNDPTLGLYRSGTSEFEYVTSGKRIVKYGGFQNVSYRDLVFQKNILIDSGVSITNGGQNYDIGTFNNVILTGGSGVNSRAELSVDEFVGTVTNQGTNYTNGQFLGVPVTGGNGTGAILTLQVDGITGTISNAGSGYVPGVYTSVPLTGGTGTGAEATVTVTGTVTTTGNISQAGSGYIVDEYTGIELLNTPTSSFVVTANATPAFVIDGVTQDTLSLVPGNTYRFDVSDASVASYTLFFYNASGLPLDSNYEVVPKGTQGQAGAFVDLIVKPSAPVGTPISYLASNAADMGGVINIVSGSVGDYGTGMVATIVTDPNQVVTGVTITDPGDGYVAGDVLTVFADDLSSPSGTGFEYTISTVTYAGTVTDVTVTDIGQNYVNGDSLSASNTNLCPYGENVGSGFAFDVTSNPGKVILSTFSNKGTGYTPNDVLSVPGRTSGLTSTLATDNTTITVTSTAGIVPGSTLDNVSGAGTFAAGTTVVSVTDATNFVISANPTGAGAVTFDLVPPYGEATAAYQFTVSRTGVVTGITIEDGGNGYEIGDTLSVSAPDLTTPITYTVKTGSVSKVDFTSTYPVAEFTVGDQVKKKDGTIVTTTTTTSTATSQGIYGPGLATTTSGNGTGATVSIERDGSGDIVSIAFVTSGFYYAVNDTLTIAGNLVGGATPADDVVLTITDVTVETPREVAEVVSAGGTNIDYLVLDSTGYSAADVLIKSGTTSPEYTINTITDTSDRFSINTGSGDSFAPNLTLYSGNTYTFNFSDASNAGHVFALSKFRDGTFEPSRISGVTTQLITANAQITVASTAGILPDMTVIVTSSNPGDGTLPDGTRVLSVDSATTITLDEVPASPGPATLQFNGNEYTDGVQRDDNTTTIQVSDTTPTTLYYYCTVHPNMGGYDNTEIAITTDPNNPKTFGSDLEITVSSVETSSTINLDIVNGAITGSDVTTNTLTAVTAEVSNTLTAPNIAGAVIAATNINSATTFNITSPQIRADGNFEVGTTFSVASVSGNVSTPGEIKTTTIFNCNDRLTITNNEIATLGTNDLILDPPASRVAKVDAQTAFIIPAGDTSARPAAGVVADGAIRYNTETNQYEGYSSSTSTWSSLGGVRDLDGNTYIAAEETVGANDNTLWFYNDNINTIRVTPNHLEFVNVKKLRSINTAAPAYTEWAAQTAVTQGSYVKYGNNLYEVTVAGTTGTTGTEPTHTTGSVVNGTATLTWNSLAVSPLTFEDIEEVKIGPITDTPLTISGDLRLVSNVISTDVSDLLLRPNAGKKTVIDSLTTLTLPVGTDAQRGIPSQGGIRFNTTSSQFEGYDGTNWGSLGGVKDVDQNTYIIPETSPGANENTLFFYNDNNKTLELTTTALDFYAVDTIRSQTSDEFEITASLMTFDSAATTLDNTSATTTFLHSSKQYFDIGLSGGVNVDPILRLDDQGDVYFNTGFGTGTFNGVKVFDGDLKEFELSDARISTDKLTLIKGTIDAANSDIYNALTERGAKTTVVAENTTTGEKEFFEFGILDDGADIYHTEYGNVRTGNQLITPTFEYTANNTARLNIDIATSVLNTHTVNITVVSNISKK
tara:strand:+ start:24 stop:4904 length:4881 start_codon:yes stop_codon:yes gene_type:complete